jgi:pyruvate,orthophosphate dikinase
VVARGMGKCCVSGCGELHISYDKKTISCNKLVLQEGDWISLNGSTGAVYEGKIDSQDPKLTGPFAMIMALADKYRKLGVRTNADTPRDTAKAVEFGAEGIGLCRTEHMFFEGDRITSFRRMILVAETVKNLRAALAACCDAEEKAGLERELAAPLKQYNQALKELLPLQRKDFIGMFKALKGRPCTVRLLDPPLHEFLPQDDAGQAEMAKLMGLSVEAIRQVVDSLHETNPMLGHRGCRLGISYPEVTLMQVRAICEAAAAVKGSQPEIMVPLVGHVKELASQKALIEQTIAEVEKAKKTKLHIKIGTMIEVPRAAITADQIAAEADFFSFGTNDLTQMTCAFSRDDAGKFLGEYVAKGFYDYDPFQVLDQDGVGRLVDIAIKYGRGVKPNLKVGVCGEHGGDPKTVAFCHRLGFTYVSCSPYRVPIARLAAAQAALKG